MRLPRNEIKAILEDYNEAISKESKEELNKANKTNGQYIAKDQQIDCQDNNCKLCWFRDAILILKTKEETTKEANNIRMFKILKTLNNNNVCFKLHQKQKEAEGWQKVKLTNEEMNKIKKAVNTFDE